MLSPSQNKAVQRWLVENSKRPQKATILWAELFDHLRRDTGEIMLSRDELAERVGTDPDSVSRIMHELASIGAIIIHRERVPGQRGPGRAVYFMNPNVATNLTGAARDRAQAAAPRLQLVETEPG
jgi:predicted transcriptional regulator